MPRQRRTRRRIRSLRSRRSRNRVRRLTFRRNRKARSIFKRARPSVNLGYLLPKQVRMTTTYVSELKNAAGASFYDESIWNASSIYDPDVAIGGHQAMLFDQMMALYNRWFVSGSSIRVELTPTLGNAVIASSQFAANGTCFLMANPVSTNVSPLDSRYLREQPTVKYTRWGNGALGPAYKNTIGSYTSIRSIIPSWSKKNPDCWGNIASGPPNDNAYWHVYFETADLSQSLNLKFRVFLTYYVTYAMIDEYIFPS